MNREEKIIIFFLGWLCIVVTFVLISSILCTIDMNKQFQIGNNILDKAIEHSKGE